MRLIRLHFFFLCLLLTAVPQARSEVYRWIDSDGRVHYSNARPSDPLPSVSKTNKSSVNPEKVALPPIKKENIDKRIKNIQENTPDNCISHGGIDCSLGADRDGSIICLDGYRDAMGTYLSLCSEVKLQADELQLFDREGKTLTPNDPALLQKLSYIEVAVRNLGGTAARRVTAEVTVPRAPYPVQGTGSSEIGSYGFAAYRLDITPLSRYLDPRNPLSAEKIRVRIRCENCVSVQKAVVAPKF